MRNILQLATSSYRVVSRDQRPRRAGAPWPRRRPLVSTFFCMPRAREKRRVSSRTHFPCSENHRARSAAPSRRCRPQRRACRGVSPSFTYLARPTTHPLHFHDPALLTLTPAQVQLRGRADAAEKPDLLRVELRSTSTIPPHHCHTQHRTRRAWLMIFDAHISPCGPHVPRSPCLAERPHRPPPTTPAACTELDPEGRPSLRHRGPSTKQPRILARGPLHQPRYYLR